MRYLKKLPGTLLGLSFWILLPPGLQAQDHACGPLVFFNDGGLEVEASGADDTANIQCALDEAKRLGLPTVRLQRSAYSVTHLEIEDFSGALEGGGASNTTLTLANEGMDCAAAVIGGQAPAGLKFIRGEVKVAKMTIGAAQPCQGGPPDIFFLVHFTGSPAGAVCSGETGFGLVDRANLIGLGSGFDLWGIGAVAEGYLFDECNQQLLGTFKLNRSLLAGFNTGVALSLRGSGQVDINFTDFGDNLGHVLVENANQLLTLQANEFMSFDSFNASHTGVEVYSDAWSPAQNRVVIYRNAFDLVEQDPLLLVNAVTVLETTPTQLSLVVSDNRFNIQSAPATGVYVEGVDSATLANNRFTGSADTGFWVSDGGNESTITGNNFENFNPDKADIYLAADTAGLITAFNAAAIIIDDGSGNIVLSSAEPIVGPVTTSTSAAEQQSADLRLRIDMARQQLDTLGGTDGARKQSLNSTATSAFRKPAEAVPGVKGHMFGRLREATQRQP